MSPRGSSGAGSGGRDSGRGQCGGGGIGRGSGRRMGRAMDRCRGGGRGARQDLGRRMGIDAPPSPVEPSHCQLHPDHPGLAGLKPESPDQVFRVQADTTMAQFQTINACVSELRGGEVPAPIDVADMEAYRKTSNNVRNGRTAAVVDKEECVNCGICADVCPEEAIVVDEIAVFDPRKCTGCGLCVEECPNESISLVVLEGATS